MKNQNKYSIFNTSKSMSYQRHKSIQYICTTFILFFCFTACGGDGTVGWILSVMDSMSFPPGQTPAIGIIPLGTGNDLSRSLNWGGKYQNKPLRKVLIDMAKADVTQMDRWTLKVAMDPSDLEDPTSTDSKHGQDQLVRKKT